MTPLSTQLRSKQDLSALSKPELRALVASARELARRADGEIAARHASFPRCLPPQFVMAWLPLGDRPCALRVSKAWHGASEALFQIVFLENGLVDRVGTWRESVFSYAREIRWAGSQPSYYPWKELNGPTTVTNREKTLLPRPRPPLARLHDVVAGTCGETVGRGAELVAPVSFATWTPASWEGPRHIRMERGRATVSRGAVRCRNAGGFPVRDLKIIVVFAHCFGATRSDQGHARKERIGVGRS